MSTKTLLGLHESYKEKGSQRTTWLEVGVARVGALGPNGGCGHSAQYQGLFCRPSLPGHSVFHFNKEISVV